MEVSLRKPQRLIFRKMMENPGCYVRSYKKTINASRIYWRLMSQNHSPLMNIPPGAMKPFFQLSLMSEADPHQYQIKEGIILADKRRKKSKS